MKSGKREVTFKGPTDNDSRSFRPAKQQQSFKNDYTLFNIPLTVFGIIYIGILYIVLRHSLCEITQFFCSCILRETVFTEFRYEQVMLLSLSK